MPDLAPSNGLVVKDLSKRFDKPVLDKCSLTVPRGQVYAVIGRSGSGKSTLLRCVSANEWPDEGSAWLGSSQYMEEGAFSLDKWQVRRRIGLVFQSLNLFPNLRVGDNLTAGLRWGLRLPRSVATERARETADALGILPLWRRYPNELSGGEAQRVAIGRAVVLQPEVLLLDEVTSALDPETTNSVVELLERIKELSLWETQPAILIITHLFGFAQSFADTIGFLHGGRILEEMPAKEFFEGCEHPDTREFVRSRRKML